MANRYTVTSKCMMTAKACSGCPKKNGFRGKLEMAQGFDGFLEVDQLLATVKLEETASSGGRDQEYWLLAERACPKPFTSVEEHCWECLRG
jgi:hypothetical protein